MNSWIRQLYKGVSWRSPLINGVFKALDIPDAAVRKFSNRSYLPPFSVRVRSRGIANQFGGVLFQAQGRFMVKLLEEHVGLDKSHDVAEIGCGCGCAAAALVESLDSGSYVGLDIDAKSIEFCNGSKRFKTAGFQFQWVDVYNSQWNPEGDIKPEQYVFPIESNSKDVVFLTSVFTHMLPDSVANYFSEISRVLKPGGKLLTTVFLMDDGVNGKSISFPHEFGDCRVHQLTYPERGVGYESSFLLKLANENGLKQYADPVLGNWRAVRADGEDDDSGFGQDILVFEK